MHKFNRNDKIILLYSDYSALQIDADTKSVESVDDVTGNLIEIVARFRRICGVTCGSGCETTGKAVGIYILRQIGAPLN